MALSGRTEKKHGTERYRDMLKVYTEELNQAAGQLSAVSSQLEDIGEKISAANRSLSIHMKFGDTEAEKQCMQFLDRQSRTIAEEAALLNKLAAAAENAVEEYRRCEDEAAQHPHSSVTEDKSVQEESVQDKSVDREYERLWEELEMLISIFFPPWKRRNGLIQYDVPMRTINLVQPQSYYSGEDVGTAVSGLAGTFLKS
ncbi:MAG: hypothetical protein LIO80_05880 [Lachnospiraceae bacterium]|nr:hypothetical protein [Lachnospiraceae bacterium]